MTPIIDYSEGDFQGQIIPHSFAPIFVVLSYLVSYVGSLTTLELLHRRTAGKGLYNWYLVIGSSFTMGGVAIWCMHYVGNRALILGNGEDAVQITYNSGFTALSFFVPVIVLMGAFFALGTNENDRLRVALGGSLVGLAVNGMHYLGQAGIENYNCIYVPGEVVASTLIAIVASIIALSIFFILRATWTNSWKKRALCAVILSAGVSGMHWVASIGTSYRLKHVETGAVRISRNGIITITLANAVAACVVLLSFAIFAQRVRRNSSNRAEQVVLACVTFDPDGRLLVTPEGLLPSQKITNSYLERSFDDIFSISHPVFLWLFRTSRNWESIKGLLVGMRNHLVSTSSLKDSRPNSSLSKLDSSNTATASAFSDYSIIFRELFCIAASELAAQISEPLENLGVLYDEILSTGHAKNIKNIKNSQTKSGAHEVNSTPGDLESGISTSSYTLGRGQLLFVVRRTTKAEAARLQTHGFRFTNVNNVAENLASSIQVPRKEIASQIEKMHNYSRSDHILEPGVHLACFAVRATLRGEFDVMVRKDARNQLPTSPLPFTALEPCHIELLSHLDGWTVSACQKHLGIKQALAPPSEKSFIIKFVDALAQLSALIEDPFFDEARLVATPLKAPCRRTVGDTTPGSALLITFRSLVPIHTRASNETLEFCPLSFFRCQQYVYNQSPDHAVFSRQVHREFAPIIEPTRTATIYHHNGNGAYGTRSSHMARNSINMIPHLTPSKSTLDQPRRFWERRPLPSPTRSHSSSERTLVENTTFGGIMVSQEITVDVRQGTALEMSSLGTSGSASTEVEDSETFVDQLFAICVEGR
ncbi:MAG: hypothetical protein M1829_002885 [Trizodia sp. TS-e1964]|nr:MAG: hypothetical protein M1829_002885 [Trizodia sp. TS-e1964]